MFLMDALFNSLLVVSSGYAIYSLHPTKTAYGYAAAICGLIHGLIGVFRAVCPEEDNECSCIKQISSGIMEIVPLPLINIELYLRSSNASLAFAHGLFLIPMAYDVMAKISDCEDSSTEALKDLTLLGNIVSMLFLAVNESNNIYGAIAALGFLARYGATVVDSYYEGTGPEIVLLGNSGVILLMAKTLKV